MLGRSRRPGEQVVAKVRWFVLRRLPTPTWHAVVVSPGYMHVVGHCEKSPLDERELTLCLVAESEQVKMLGP